MNWHDSIFAYCERASDPGLWAEPFNAISNAAFLVATYFAGRLYLRTGANDYVVAFLIGLIALIGVGSFLFHTIATRWAALADVLPIATFRLIYMAFALRRLASLPVVVVIVLMAAYFATVYWTFSIECRPNWLPATALAGKKCLNGSVVYLPTLLSLLTLCAILAVKRHRWTSQMLLAAIVFATSLTFRTLDYELCEQVQVLGASRGTHTLWHMLNAVLLYILVRTAIYSAAPRSVLLQPSSPAIRGATRTWWNR